MRFLGQLIIFTLVIACSSYKKSASNKVEIDKKNQVAISKIAFTNYAIYKNSSTSLKVELIDKIIVEGNLKQRKPRNKPIKNGDFLCLQLGTDFKHLDTIIIQNPLIKHVEYVDSKGMLNKKLIELDSTSMFIRFQLKPQTKYIGIVKNNITLLKTKL